MMNCFTRDIGKTTASECRSKKCMNSLFGVVGSRLRRMGQSTLPKPAMKRIAVPDQPARRSFKSSDKTVLIRDKTSVNKMVPTQSQYIQGTLNPIFADFPIWFLSLITSIINRTRIQNDFSDLAWNRFLTQRGLLLFFHAPVFAPETIFLNL